VARLKTISSELTKIEDPLQELRDIRHGGNSVS
jgi:hypothetical protein